MRGTLLIPDFPSLARYLGQGARLISAGLGLESFKTKVCLDDLRVPEELQGSDAKWGSVSGKE